MLCGTRSVSRRTTIRRAGILHQTVADRAPLGVASCNGRALRRDQAGDPWHRAPRPHGPAGIEEARGGSCRKGDWGLNRKLFALAAALLVVSACGGSAATVAPTTAPTTAP